MTREFSVERVTPALIGALSALFERTGTACHCEWWHFEGDKNAWLERCFHHPEQNRDAFRARVESARGPLGLVALATSGKVVGWMKLTDSGAVRKLYEQRVYRGLPCFDGDRGGVLTIGCFLVDPEWRRIGVAAALLEGGIALARELGANAIEAFPRVGTELRDYEIWTGPAELFRRSGFEVVSDALASYPVLRKVLRPDLG